MLIPAIDRPKLLTILSFVFSLPAGYYFINAAILQAIIFILLSDVSGAAAARLQNGNLGWKPAIKIAIERCADAAIFIGFALSGMAPEFYGILLLVLAIIVPFWVQAIWKKNVRLVFHAIIYLYATLIYV